MEQDGIMIFNSAEAGGMRTYMKKKEVAAVYPMKGAEESTAITLVCGRTVLVAASCDEVAQTVWNTLDGFAPTC